MGLCSLLGEVVLVSVEWRPWGCRWSRAVGTSAITPLFVWLAVISSFFFFPTKIAEHLSKIVPQVLSCKKPEHSVSQYSGPTGGSLMLGIPQVSPDIKNRSLPCRSPCSCGGDIGKSAVYLAVGVCRGQTPSRDRKESPL